MTTQEVFPNRIGRLECFTWWLILYVGVLLGVLVGAYFNIHWLVVSLVAIMFWGTIMISRRRLHDLGHSGWLTMLLLVPLVNLAVVTFLLLQKGEDKNRYGSPTPSRSAFGVLFRFMTGRGGPVSGSQGTML